MSSKNGLIPLLKRYLLLYVAGAGKLEAETTSNSSRYPPPSVLVCDPTAGCDEIADDTLRVGLPALAREDIFHFFALGLTQG